MTEAKPKKYDPVRGAAMDILCEAEKLRRNADEIIIDFIHRHNFDARDIRFLRQLVHGSIKLKRRLDHDIRFYLSHPSEKLPVRLQAILRLGFYQLFFTDRIPEAAIVSEAVNLARHFVDPARARLVNAVLRSAIRNPQRRVFIDPRENPVQHLADYYSYPDWFVEYCLTEFKYEATEKLLGEMNNPPYLSFRANHIKAKPEQIAELLKGQGIEYRPGRYLKEFFITRQAHEIFDQLASEGKIYIQDESAALPVRLMNPKPAMRVLDLAAAPGGKASYAAVRMRNEGLVAAVDRSRPRLKILAENCKTMGIKIVSPVHADNLEFTAEPFDRVLLDAPCTGWGNAGKHSDLRWIKTPDDVEQLHKVQSMMIDKAAKLVRPGGILVYSTCTVLRKENDEVVEEFLIRRKDFVLESADKYFGDDIVSERGFIKTYPDVEFMSGSFAARLKKTKNP